jgi:XapX domain-containing protein
LEVLAVKIYVLSLSVGLLVGVIYGLLNVRSPAPPVIALIGLLGILVGEQLVPLAKRLVSSEPVSTACVREQCVPHIFGQLPGKTAESQQPNGIDAPSESHPTRM